MLHLRREAWSRRRPARPGRGPAGGRAQRCACRRVSIRPAGVLPLRPRRPAHGSQGSAMNPVPRPIPRPPLCLGALPACKRERAEALPRTAAPQPAWLEGRLEPEPPGLQPQRGGSLVIRVPSEPVGLCRLHDQMRDAFMTRYTVGPVYETLLELDRQLRGRALRRSPSPGRSARTARSTSSACARA